MKDVQSITMTQALNSSGFDLTLREEGGRLLQFIKRRVKSQEDAEDVFQDVFSQLLEAYRGLEQIERVTGWLFRVAKNKIADLYRRRRPEPLSRFGKRGSDDESGDSLTEIDRLSGGSNPEELLLRKHVWQELELALTELPRAQREVFEWHEIEGMSFEEMSILTGENENTLRMRKYHAVQHLRRRLKGLYP